jgi:hypothetical protein
MAADAASLARYGLRRVNPFLGVVAVVRTTQGRALSFDGNHWQLQVLAHPPRGLWSRDGHREEAQFFRFGVWSEATGMSRVPLNPILDVGHMLAVADELIESVQAALPALPFPLAPERELWLLDQEQTPLALLATALPDSDLAALGSPDWTAGGRGERTIVSARLLAREIPERDASGRFPHAEALERLVQAAAGRRLKRQWFRREADAAEGLPDGAPPELAGRRLPAADFPVLPLRTDWPRAEDRELVEDYVDWVAPYLLTLTGLGEALRARLEQAAQHHALLVDALWRLYPRIIDPELINRARVEARLRRANA